MSVTATEWQKEHPWEPSATSSPQPVPLVSPADLFNPMLTVGEVMKRDAATCAADTPVAEAVKILRDSASSAVFIVSDGRPLGLLTARSVALAVADRGDDLPKLRAADLMTHPTPTVPSDVGLEALLDCFLDEGVAVVDSNRRMVGVVRWRELLGHLSERALGRLVVNLFSPQKER